MLRSLPVVLLALSFLLPEPTLARAKARGGKVRESSSKVARPSGRGPSEKVSSRASAADDRADGAFAEAQKAHAALRKDAKRRQFRDQWVGVAQKYESLAERYPASPRAAEALFEAAELYAALSRVSLAKRDLREAVEAYGRLCERFPKSRLADDAHLALGRIYRDRMDDTGKAEAEFRAAAAGNGDQKARARAELASLPRKAVSGKDERRAEPRVAKAEPEARPEPARPAAEPEAKVEAKAEAKAEASPLRLTLATRDEEDEEDEADAVAIDLPVKNAPAAPAEIDPARVKALKAAARSEVPLSVQVGLKVKRVIIDPGHGGHDVGAIGPGGTYEKDVTLAISEKLKARLEADGYEAVLVRDSDKFVSLEDRARFANRRKGDLFVSVHCNAHKSRKMRGVETYTLNVTSDQYSIRLAARENASSERKLGDLQFILADLATKANTTDSVRLARAVQSELVEASSTPKSKARDLGVKQALFYVLLGVRMPSVLVETAFLSNPDDEKLLKDPARQKALAEAIAEGVGRFVAERDALASLE